jgi:hypothetical protein
LLFAANAGERQLEVLLLRGGRPADSAFELVGAQAELPAFLTGEQAAGL